MGEEKIKEIKKNIGDGRVVELNPKSSYTELVMEMISENFSPTNYEAMLPAFVEPLLKKVGEGSPVLLSMVAFQQDLVIPVVTYYSRGTRRFASAMNAITLPELTMDDIDDYGRITSERFLDSFRLFQLPEELEYEIISGIERKVEVMTAYLGGRVLDSELINVTPPGIEPGLHD